MKVKCEYCDNYIDETDAQCPYCGAPNEHMMRSGSGVPKTIDELLAFAEARSIPLEKMRFFVGQDCHEARAFGIYRDGEGKFVVYKNKADGTRAVRYRGDDEAYAVNEIYEKMRSEVLQRRQAKGAEGGRSATKAAARQKSFLIKALVIGIVVSLAFGGVAGYFAARNARRGYYRYDNAYYYYDDGWWRDTGYDWVSTDAPTELDENYEDYYEGRDYDGLGDSSVTEWVSDTDDDDWFGGWDDDDWSSSDWDSWDSSDTDWDSDW